MLCLCRIRVRQYPVSAEEPIRFGCGSLSSDVLHSVTTYPDKLGAGSQVLGAVLSYC